MNVNYGAKSEMLRVIAHPVRLMILEELCKGIKCVTEVEQVLTAVRQPNISQHLAVLRHCKIVDFQQEGKKRCYFVTNPEMISALLDILEKERPPKPVMAAKETIG